jgi:hypothetical protein
MHGILRSASLAACVVLGLSIGFAPSPAFAEAKDQDMTRLAQVRLADLGHYAGHSDGQMGPETKTAIEDFQRTNGLPVDGELTAETYDLLLRMDYRNRSGTGIGRPNEAPAPASDSRVDAEAPQPWQYIGAVHLPLRYGDLNIYEDDRGTMKRYTVLLNGKPLFQASDEPYDMRVSKSFELDGEDAVIFTAYQGDESCAYNSYLMTVAGDGSGDYKMRKIGSCANTYQVRVANNALFISFPGVVNPEGWVSWDVWRYENAWLIRL